MKRAAANSIKHVIQNNCKTILDKAVSDLLRHQMSRDLDEK